MNTKFLCTILLLLWFWVGSLGAEPNFQKIDERALRAPASLEHSLDDLVRYLCPAHYSETEKARSLFRWIAHRIVYDVEGLRTNKMGSQKAPDVLKRRRAVCEGYSRLYQAMAEKAGLQATYITGRSHFNGQLPFALPANIQGHAWNAILLRGRWRLMDVTWAAGHVNDEGKFTPRFNDFWFSTPPEQFVFTHLPETERWQLLSAPWTAARFDRTPRLTGHFFAYGLKLTQGQQEPLVVTPETVVRWPAPADVVAISDLRDEKGLVQKGWTLTQSPHGFVETRVRCPRPGKYTLRVYCRKRQAPWQADPKNPDSYDGVATYQVVAQKPQGPPFPSTFGTFQRAGAELLGPHHGTLKKGARELLRVKISGAAEVVAFSGGKILATLKPQSGIHQAWITVPATGTLQISARYTEEPRYWGLVDYKIQ
mgnify:CR=1 FL=1